MAVALALVLSGVYSGTFRQFRNIWALVFIGTMVVSMTQAPRFSEFLLGYIDGRELSVLGNRPISGFWMAKTVLYVIVLFLAMVVIASHDWTVKEIHTAFKIMMWCGLVMAGYVFIQKMGLDQYFVMTKFEKNTDIYALENPTLAGTLGQPTLCAAYLASVIPVTLFLKRYWVSLVIGAAVVMLGSKMAILGGLATGLWYLFGTKGWPVKIAFVLSICSIILVSGYVYNHRTELWNKVQSESSGRTLAWAEIYKDFTTPPLKNNSRKFTITGFGPGAFEYTHSIRHNNRWWQAHNEYLEILYNHGILGVVALFMAFQWMFKNVLLNDEITRVVMATTICVLILGLGQFVLRIWPVTMIFVLMLGLLHNESFLNQEYQEDLNVRT